MSNHGRTATNQRNADARFREEQAMKNLARERAERAEKIAHLRDLRRAKEEEDRRQAAQS